MKKKFRKLSEKQRLERLDVLAKWMDSFWKVPGTELEVGFESILGLIPIVGDGITALASTWIIKEAHQLGAPLNIKLKMVRNVVIDLGVGVIPMVGDIFDVGWHASRKNVTLLKNHVQSAKIKSHK